MVLQFLDVPARFVLTRAASLRLTSSCGAAAFTRGFHVWNEKCSSARLSATGSFRFHVEVEVTKRSEVKSREWKTEDHENPMKTTTITLH
jgi:hypothetical protein